MPKVFVQYRRHAIDQVNLACFKQRNPSCGFCHAPKRHAWNCRCAMPIAWKRLQRNSLIAARPADKLVRTAADRAFGKRAGSHSSVVSARNDVEARQHRNCRCLDTVSPYSDREPVLGLRPEDSRKLRSEATLEARIQKMVQRKSYVVSGKAGSVMETDAIADSDLPLTAVAHRAPRLCYPRTVQDSLKTTATLEACANERVEDIQVNASFRTFEKRIKCCRSSRAAGIRNREAVTRCCVTELRHGQAGHCKPRGGSNCLQECSPCNSTPPGLDVAILSWYASHPIPLSSHLSLTPCGEHRHTAPTDVDLASQDDNGRLKYRPWPGAALISPLL